MDDVERDYAHGNGNSSDEERDCGKCVIVFPSRDVPHQTSSREKLIHGSPPPYVYNLDPLILHSRSQYLSIGTPYLYLKINDHGESPSSIVADKPERERDMTIYENRLETFEMGPQSWPRARPTAERLAQLGFFYTGHEHRVQCHYCKVVIGNWDNGVDPLIKHHDRSPRCPFILDGFQAELTELLSLRSVKHFNPQYSNSSARLHSFSTWPISSIVPSYQLASVGFYYTGYGRKVECFSCGFSYKLWRSGDIPLNIHRQYNPHCVFLNSLLKKDPPSLPQLHSHSDPPPPLPQLHSHSATHHADLTTKSPDYANETVRLKSFKHLPVSVPVSAEACARAGLYFLRKPDVMRCFSCHAVVKGWVDGDVPEEKHREVSPHCKFLQEFFPTKLSSAAAVDPSTLPEPQYNHTQLKKLSEAHKGSDVDPSSLPEPFYNPSRPFPETALSPNFHQHSYTGPSYVSTPSSTNFPMSSSTSEGNQICVVCMDAPLEMVLVPCGHLCVCENCSTLVKQCPMCRRPAENALRVFLP